MSEPVRRALAALLACVALSFAATDARAHGDTIRLSYAGVRPARLVVKAGTTVHFHNANSSGAVCTVVLGDGAVESPPLGRAEGWHYTFEEPGTFDFHIAEYSSRRGQVVVVVNEDP